MTRQQLRNHRRQLGLTQAQLAGTLGVTIRRVRNWERGRSPISRLVELAMRSVSGGAPFEPQNGGGLVREGITEARATLSKIGRRTAA